MDPVELAILGLSAGCFTLLALLLLGIRQIPAYINAQIGNMPKLIEQFLWQDELDEKGKIVARKPSAQLVGIVQAGVPLLAPVFMKEVGTWAQANLMKGGGAGGAGGGGSLDLANMDPELLTKALGMKKSQAGLVGLALPFIQRFLGGALGPKTTAITTTATVVPPNPFMK